MFDQFDKHFVIVEASGISPKTCAKRLCDKLILPVESAQLRGIYAHFGHPIADPGPPSSEATNFKLWLIKQRNSLKLYVAQSHGSIYSFGRLL